MSVLMQFVSTTGSYTFDVERMPLFSRRLDFMRPTDQGHGGRKLICTLQGFLEGKSHVEVMNEYDKLYQVIKANDVTFTYKTDATTTVMVNQRVYMDDYADPADWKEYNGDYFLTFHYFEKPDFDAELLGIQASYLPRLDLKQQDPQKTDVYVADKPPEYKFDPPPLWSTSLKKNRGNFRGSAVTAYGRPIGSEATVTLNGRLYGKDHTELRQKIDALKEAFRYDGDLAYGAFQNAVRVEDIQIPTVFPRDYCDYTITLKYDTEGVIEFHSRRRMSRSHRYPRITEIPACGTVRVQTFEKLGQTINYYVHIKASSQNLARSYLTQELANLVYPGGTELAGGTEEWDDDDTGVTLAFSVYYTQPPVNTIPIP